MSNQNWWSFIENPCCMDSERWNWADYRKVGCIWQFSYHIQTKGEKYRILLGWRYGQLTFKILKVSSFSMRLLWILQGLWKHWFSKGGAQWDRNCPPNRSWKWAGCGEMLSFNSASRRTSQRTWYRGIGKRPENHGKIMKIITLSGDAPADMTADLRIERIIPEQDGYLFHPLIRCHIPLNPL